MNPAEIGRPAPQRHLIWMYFGFVVLWGMSVDHAQALLRDYGYLKWLSAAVICALALTVLRKAAGRINVWGISTPLCLLILWVVLSGIVNSSSVTHTLVWLVFYLKYVLFLVYLNNLPLRPETTTKLLWAIAVFGLLLVVEGYVRAALGMFEHPDQLSFVLGPHGTLNVGLICSVGVIFLAAQAFVTRRWSYLLLCLLMISISVPGEIKALTLGGPAVVVAVYFAWVRGTNRNFPYMTYLFRSVVVVILLVGLFSLYKRVSNPDTSQIMMTLVENVKTWIWEGGRLNEAGLSRVSTVAEVTAQLREDEAGLLLGRGPGTTFLVGGEARRFVIGAHSWNQVAMVLADIGVVGLALYGWMLIRLALPGLKLIRHLRSFEQRQQVLILTFAGMSVYYIVLSPMYDLVWRYDAVGYVFFLLTGTMYRLAADARQRCETRVVAAPRRSFPQPPIDGWATGRTS